ncbi:MAG TPA: TIGR03435 family protein [Bryobacteraceae bacterium]|nr:TIGR03435 family protein [Bryobacteraceae bacterium]
MALFESNRCDLFGGQKRRDGFWWALLAIGLIAGVANSQQAQGRLVFETASVKASKSVDQTRGGLFSPGGRYEAVGIPLRSVILTAYEIPPVQLIGGPAWLDTDGFDISARAEAGSVAPGLLDRSNLHRLHLMLRSLLEDRFRLSVHRETKQGPLYELVVAKAGFKLQALKDADCKVANPGTDLGCGDFTKTSRNGSLAGPRVKISDVAEMLPRLLDRPVIDKTRIEGYFNLDLRWTVRTDAALDVDSSREDRRDQRQAVVDGSDLTIFAALEQQLGLRLEAKKGPIEALIVDHVERPSAN